MAYLVDCIGIWEILVFFGTLIISYICVYVLSYIFRPASYPPGPLGLPIVGILPFLRGKRLPDIFLDYAEKYGDIFSIKYGQAPAVVVNGYENIKQALTGRDDFNGRFPAVTCTFTSDGKSMAFNTLSKAWHVQRKTARNALNVFIRKPNIADDIAKEAQVLADEFLEYKGKPFDPRDHFNMCTMCVIYSVCFGADSTLRHSNGFKDFVTTFNRVSTLPGGNLFDLIPITRYLFPASFHNTKESLLAYSTFMKNKIKSHQEYAKAGINRGVTDVLFDMVYVKQSNKMSTEGITEEHIMNLPIELTIAGTATVANILYWIVLYLVTEIEVQKKLLKEIHEILKDDVTPNQETLKHMPYTEAVIWETLRISTSNTFLLPHYTVADSTLGEYNIPKDTFIFFNVKSVTHDSSRWLEPNKFKPERFLLPDGSFNRSVTEYALPFGFGKRRCLGEILARLEIYIILCTLLRKCEFVRVEGEVYDRPPTGTFTADPQPFMVKVIRR